MELLGGRGVIHASYVANVANVVEKVTNFNDSDFTFC